MSLEAATVEATHKFGSNLIADEAGVDDAAIEGYVQGYHQSGITQAGLIVVTSGAVAVGSQRAERLMSTDEISRLTLRQKAALGCTAVFNTWEQIFADYGIAAASFPITHHQLAGPRWRDKAFNRREKIAFSQTLLDNARLGIVTIINEADALSDIELMKLRSNGDNDGLAAHIAKSVGSRTLTIFAKLGGIFDEDRQLITCVDRSNIDVVRDIAARRDTSLTGRGGLKTKVDACWDATRAGVYTRIAGVSSDMSGIDATEFVLR